MGAEFLRQFPGTFGREEKSVIQMVGISSRPLHLENVFDKMLNPVGSVQFRSV